MITVVCVPSSADVSARAVTMLSPSMAKKLVSLVVNVPVNVDPSDIVTVAVAIRVPTPALSAIVEFAGVSAIAIGTGDGGGGGGDGAMFTVMLNTALPLNLVFVPLA